jgi:uncharacterized protein with PQ loop repeat
MRMLNRIFQNTGKGRSQPLCSSAVALNKTSTLNCSLRRVVAHVQCTIIALITDKTIVQHSGEVDLFSTYAILILQVCIHRIYPLLCGFLNAINTTIRYSRGRAKRAPLLVIYNITIDYKIIITYIAIYNIVDTQDT